MCFVTLSFEGIEYLSPIFPPSLRFILMQSKDEEEYKRLRKEFQEGAMTKYWTWIEGIIQENGGCFISGDKPNYADLLVAQSVPAIQSGMWDHIDKDFFEAYPGVLATKKGIEDNEEVKAYYNSKKKGATTESEL